MMKKSAFFLFAAGAAVLLLGCNLGVGLSDFADDSTMSGSVVPKKAFGTDALLAAAAQNSHGFVHGIVVVLDG